MITLRKLPTSAVPRRTNRCPMDGFGIAIAHRHASADFWFGNEGRVFARFCTSKYRHYFEIISGADLGVSLFTPADIEQALQFPLLNWLLDAMDDGFE